MAKTYNYEKGKSAVRGVATIENDSTHDLGGIHNAVAEATLKEASVQFSSTSISSSG